MPRELKPCGTLAAYRRHRRHGEQACDACLTAVAADKAERKADGRKREAAVVRLAVAAQPVIQADEEIDDLADARQNLRLIRAAMDEATPSSMAALSKRRDELVDRIKKLEARTKNEGGGLLDQLSARRAARIAGAAT